MKKGPKHPSLNKLFLTVLVGGIKTVFNGVRERDQNQSKNHNMRVFFFLQ